VTMAFFRPLAIVCQYTDSGGVFKRSFWGAPWKGAGFQ
jgi:hypothetical protein